MRCCVGSCLSALATELDDDVFVQTSDRLSCRRRPRHVREQIRCLPLRLALHPHTEIWMCDTSTQQ